MMNVLEPRADDAAETPESFARTLRGYVGEVAHALGVGLESCMIDPGRPASVYIALDITLARFPDRDLALLWDERFGWSAAVEARSGEDPLVVACQDGNPMPDPCEVSAFVTALAAARPRSAAG